MSAVEAISAFYRTARASGLRVIALAADSNSAAKMALNYGITRPEIRVISDELSGKYRAELPNEFDNSAVIIADLSVVNCEGNSELIRAMKHAGACFLITGTTFNSMNTPAELRAQR